MIKKKQLLGYLYFLLSPLLGLIYGLFKIKEKYSLKIFFLFCCVFGFTFQVENPLLDSFRYRELFYDYQYLNFNVFWEKFIAYINFDSNQRDFYFDCISFIVSRFTINYHYLFLILAVIFALFFLKSLVFFVRNTYFNYSLVAYILLIMFVMSNPIFNINGVRFWTASWIAVYASLQIFIGKKRKYILLGVMTAFFHGSFILYAGILLFSFFVPKNKYIFRFLCALYFISFFFSHLAVPFLKYIIEFLPSSLRTFSSYLKDENLMRSELVGTGFYWVEKVFSILTSFAVFIIMFYLMNKRVILKKYRLINLFILVLCLAAFSNFTMSIPSVGNRFMYLCYPLLAYIGLHFVYSRLFRGCCYFYLCVSVFSFILILRHHSDVTGFLFYFISPAISVLKNI